MQEDKEKGGAEGIRLLDPCISARVPCDATSDPELSGVLNSSISDQKHVIPKSPLSFQKADGEQARDQVPGSSGGARV